MRGKRLMNAVLVITAILIFLPVIVILIWSVTARWPWHELLPESYTLRTMEELLFGSHKLAEILISSIVLATLVAILSTVIGMMTARATEIYRVR
jgi:putative spermidine/putrescine transport system permease protein